MEIYSVDKNTEAIKLVVAAAVVLTITVLVGIPATVGDLTDFDPAVELALIEGLAHVEKKVVN